MLGTPFTVTATFCVAVLPKLSLALTVMLSVPAVPFVSVSVVRSAFTWLSVPVMIRSSVPLLAGVAPVADSNPVLSFSSTVKVSVAVAATSDITTLVIASV